MGDWLVPFPGAADSCSVFTTFISDFAPFE